jgi:dTDP-4-amino-4,6-dideoxygalactose transaminase
LASLSFHETKNVICGEGGALVINDPQWVERAEILREKGTNRNRFFRGQVDKYTWVDVGSSYLMSDLSAAFLFAQLEQWQAIQAKRRAIWEAYYEGLQTWAASRQVGLPHIPPEAHQAYHLFYLLMPSLEDRQAFIQHLAGRGIGAAFHYQALHLSATGQQWGGRPGDCPVAERMSDCLVRLPFFYTLSDEQQAYVIESILAF